MIDDTHDPDLESWVASANDRATDFPIQSLPYATFRSPGQAARERVGVGIGDFILDISSVFGIASLLELMQLPRLQRIELRRRISHFLSRKSNPQPALLEPIENVELLLPCAIGDYTDFYASIHHASNVGRMFRPDNPLLPNYKWLPVGYHGRASSIVVSGTPVHRPWGQIADMPAGPPRFAPTERLDYEVELGAFLGPGNEIGQPVPMADAEDQLFGVCLLNDWSARDVQTWEYQPLGPFLSKSFATSISAWIITQEALEPFRTGAPERPAGDPQPLPHLRQTGAGAFHIQLEAWLRTPSMSEAVRISRADFADMYWTLGQMIAHHASNGCPLRAGDLIGSGTVSGPEKHNRGCLLEMTWRGAEPLALPNGETRTFLQDGDEVTLRGWCEAPGFRRIGWGTCDGTVMPARGEPKA